MGRGMFTQRDADRWVLTQRDVCTGMLTQRDAHPEGCGQRDVLPGHGGTWGLPEDRQAHVVVGEEWIRCYPTAHPRWCSPRVPVIGGLGVGGLGVGGLGAGE